MGTWALEYLYFHTSFWVVGSYYSYLYQESIYFFSGSTPKLRNLWGSGDFGANWDQADPAFALQWSDIDVTDHDTVIAVTSDSIIASSIAGAMGPYLQTNFSHLPLLMNTVVASPDLSYTVALAEWGVGNNGLYISTDGGQTFTQSNSSEAPDAQAETLNPKP